MIIWKTVDVVDNQNMTKPHVLQQKAKANGTLRSEHRLIPISDLNGIDE